MIFNTKSKQMAIISVVILIFSFFSVSFSSEILLIINRSLTNEITTSPDFSTNLSFNSQINQKKTQSPQVLRVLDNTAYIHKDLPLFDYLVYQSSASSFIFDTLVDYDFNTGEIVPSLALNWVVTKDSKQWLFILREDVFFHDGSQFNASAVKFNYDRLIDPSHPAYYHEELFGLTGNFPLESVDVINNFRVMFTFSTPFAPFLEVQASEIEIIAPTSFLGANISNLVGTGPYQYDYHVQEEDKRILVLTRNSNYFHGFAPFEKVNYDLYYDFEDCNDSVHAELADIAPFNPPMESDTDYWVNPPTGDGIVYLGFLNHNNEVLSNLKVRLALNYAVDKFQFASDLDNLGYRGGPALQSIFPRFMPYRNDSVPGYPYDVNIANQLLDEAGYPREINGYRFNLTITTFEERRERAELLNVYFDAIGINCTIITYLGAEAVDKVFNQSDFELAVFGFPELYNPSLLHLFLHSNGLFNAGNYSNQLMDDALELSLTSPVHQEREFYNGLIQAIAQDDAPYLLLFENVNDYCRAGHVAGLVKLNKNYRFGFNYSISSTSDIFSYTDIPISSDPIYFPFTDVLITQSNEQTFNISLSMSYELEQYFHSSSGTGKFIQVSTDQKSVKYRLRCYYNSFEVEELSLDHFYVYDHNSNSWSLLDIIASNNSLRYVEVELKEGLHFLSLGKKFSFITYKLVPIISLLFGSVLLFAILIVFYNQLQLNRFKRRYNL